jgi:hypothetical protein
VLGHYRYYVETSYPIMEPIGYNTTSVANELTEYDLKRRIKTI